MATQLACSEVSRNGASSSETQESTQLWPQCDFSRQDGKVFSFPKSVDIKIGHIYNAWWWNDVKRIIEFCQTLLSTAWSTAQIGHLACTSCKQRFTNIALTHIAMPEGDYPLQDSMFQWWYQLLFVLQPVYWSCIWSSLKGESHGWLYRHVCPSLHPHPFSAKLRRRSCLSSFLCCNKTHLQVDLVSIKNTVFMDICTVIHELYHFLLCNIWLA